MKRYVAEAIGTFVLVFAGTGAIIIDDLSRGAVTHVGVALTFGLAVMTMIYAIGDISGAHLNCAVTIAFWVARRFSGRYVLPYILAQLFGGISASVVLRLMFTASSTLGATTPMNSPVQSFVLETILTAILMFVILSVSSGPKEKGTMAGIAVGGVIAFEALFAGPISGASMNPARSIAPAIVSGHLHALWIYIAGPILGALLAVVVHRVLASSACENDGVPVAFDASSSSDKVSSNPP